MLTLRHISLILVATMALLAGCSKEAKLARYRQRANKDFTAGNYAQAEVEYMNLLRSNPSDPVAIRQLGFVFFEQGRLPQALQFLIKAHELEPDNIETSGKLGSAYMAAQQYKLAEQLALHTLEKEPANGSALVLLADTADTEEKLKNLRARVTGLQASNPDLAAFHIVLGELSIRERNLTNALAELQKAVSLQPTNAVAQMALGNVYLVQKDQANADKVLKAAADNSPWRSATKLKYADFKVQSGKVDEGKAIISEMIKQAPDYIPAYAAMMNLSFNARDYDECAVWVEKIRTRDPMNFEALITSGRLKLAKGDFDHAIEALEKTANIYERAPLVHHNLALAYLGKGDLSKAMLNLNHAISADPHYVPSIMVIAEMNLAKGDFANAISTLSQLIQRHPELENPYLLLAQAYLMQRQYDEAAVQYRRVIELFPSLPEPYYYLGTVLAVEKKNAEARQAFEKSLEVSPTYLLALEQLVDLDIREKNYAAAIDRVNKQSDPQKPSAVINMLLAKVHSSQNDTASAERDLLKAIELAPENNKPYILISELYVRTHKQQEALDRLNKFVANTNDVAALMQIGVIQQMMTNYNAARDTYEKLLTVRPNFSLALNNLAYLYCEQLNDLDKAQKLAETAREVMHGDPATADTLGWVAYKRGDYARARALIGESAQQLSNEAEVQYHLGLTHYMLGEEPAARAALDRVVQSTSAKKDQKLDAQQHLAVLDGTDVSGKPLSRESLEKLSAENPNDPVVLAHLAALYESEGSNDKAIALYQRAIKANRKNTTVLLKLAQYYAHVGNDAAQALDLAKEAHNLAPYDVQINRLLGRLAYDTGDYSWSVSLLQQAARNVAPNGDLYYDLAWAYYNVGNLTEAESAMRSALQTGTASKDDANRFLALLEAYNNPSRNPNVDASDAKYVPALMVTASRQQQQGKSDQAKLVLEQVLAKNPLFVPAARDLAVLLAHENSNDAKAYSLAVKAREAFPDDADVSRALGILSYRKGEYRRAIELLKESQQKRAEDGELFFYLGMAHYKLNQAPDAKSELQRALQWKVESKLSDEATRVLAELK
ncbi:MAG: tetratricopeptide repeat protein [Limisphaerales bacterium]